MSRLYETQEDLDREARVFRLAAEMFGWTGYKLDGLSHQDRLVIDEEGRPYRYVEIKTRTTSFQRYPDYRIDVHKLAMGVEIGKLRGVPFVLLVGFTDGIYMVTVNQERFDRWPDGWIERKDRNDPLDQDLAKCIPLKAFIRVCATWGMDC